MSDIADIVKKEMSNNKAISEIKTGLLKKGYSKKEIDDALRKISSSQKQEKEISEGIFTSKEVFDRIGYGFVGNQFVNILFMFSGASIFLIGLVNGLKTVFNSLISSFVSEYLKIKNISKSFISAAGILFGISFLFMAFAVVIKSPLLFAVALLAGGIGIVSSGEAYLKLMHERLKKEKTTYFLTKISYFGLLITGVSMLLSGFLMDKFPSLGIPINLSLFGYEFNMRIYGYLISFEITAVMFIISGYLMSFLKESISFTKYHFYNFIIDYFRTAKENTKVFTKNKFVFLMMIATVITSIVQILGNSYYGIFIYKYFKNSYFGGFMNVAVIFLIALLFAFLGPWITRKFSKKIGEAPMLVFGILLMAILPLTFYFNPNFISIAVATAFSIIGSAILGTSQGLMASRLLNEDELKKYFSGLSFVSIIPFILIVPIGAFIADSVSLGMLFLIIGIILAFIVMPLYFAIVAMSNKR